MGSFDILIKHIKPIVLDNCAVENLVTRIPISMVQVQIFGKFEPT